MEPPIMRPHDDDLLSFEATGVRDLGGGTVDVWLKVRVRHADGRAPESFTCQLRYDFKGYDLEIVDHDRPGVVRDVSWLLEYGEPIDAIGEVAGSLFGYAPPTARHTHQFP
jgi:hypothetical protein